MKSFKYISIVLVALLTLVGCKDKMRELNTNADLVDDTQVIYMFTGATTDYNGMGRSRDNIYGNLLELLQYHVYYTGASKSTPYRNPEFDGATTPSYYGQTYSNLFSSHGYKLTSILNYIDEQVSEQELPRYNDIYAVCRGLVAYEQWQVLENYGATVYAEAFKAIQEGITQPHYEFIEDLYTEIDDEFKAAINVLKADPAENTIKLGTSDYFAGYTSSLNNGTRGGAVIATQGDYTKQRAAWLRFFNNVRLEIAWKLQGVAPSFFSSVFSECNSVATAGGLMKSVDDGFFFNYRHDFSGDDDMQEVCDRKVVAEPFMNFLLMNQDPRVPYLARFNGATEKSGVAFNMMKAYFPDSLAKYPYLDGKHPYMGLNTNPMSSKTPMEKQNASDPNPFVTNHLKSFNDLPNPNYPDEFKFTDVNGHEYLFAEKDAEKFNCSILVGDEVAFRYFVQCGAGRQADHAYGGNGIKGLSDATYYKKYCSDGYSREQDGSMPIAIRDRMFGYAKQCFLLALIGQTYAGVSAADWYKKGVQAAFDELSGEACRTLVQAYFGGDTGHEYPASLTQATPNGDVTYNFPYKITQAQIDAYIAAHPFNADNLGDQIWVYGYIDPYTVLQWRRKTGYPKFKEHATPEAAAAEVHAYFEQPYSGDGDKLVMPRRGCLPDRNTLNENFLDAKNHLLSMSGFGNWEETQYGIWWEVPYM